VAVSTATHEYYGIAALEALAAGCRPLLPDRLAYPELLADRADAYGDRRDLERRLAELAGGPDRLRSAAERRRWRALAEPHAAERGAAALDRVCAEAAVLGPEMTNPNAGRI
jgi:hypothetical protein